MTDIEYDKELVRRVSHTYASIKYNRSNVKQVKMNLNLKTDADILEHLATVGNVQGYIKNLIRQDMRG
jgi:hypothetical protein